MMFVSSLMGSGKIEKVVKAICQTHSRVQSREVSIIGMLYPYINYTGDISKKLWGLGV